MQFCRKMSATLTLVNGMSMGCRSARDSKKVGVGLRRFSNKMTNSQKNMGRRNRRQGLHKPIDTFSLESGPGKAGTRFSFLSECALAIHSSDLKAFVIPTGTICTISLSFISLSFVQITQSHCPFPFIFLRPSGRVMSGSHLSAKGELETTAYINRSIFH